MESENIIEIKHLCKAYEDVKAVNDLSFRVKKGEFFAFLGINGAGKSTTINIMSGNLSFDYGSVFIDGYDVTKEMDQIRSELGVVYQSSRLDNELSVYDNLVSRAGLYGLKGQVLRDRIEELAELFDLKPIFKRDYKKLSGGQRRRVDIARALIHKPKILILNEPTTGLDPQTRKQVWSVIHSLRKKEGLTVFLTTHYMEETADAEYVVILNKGVIAAEGSPLMLKEKYSRDYIVLYGEYENELKKLNIKYETIRDGYRIIVDNMEEARDLIINNPKLFKDFEVYKGKMDDVFLAVTGVTLGGDKNE